VFYQIRIALQLGLYTVRLRQHGVKIYIWGFSYLDYSFDVLISWSRKLSLYNWFCYICFNWIFDSDLCIGFWFRFQDLLTITIISTIIIPYLSLVYTLPVPYYFILCTIWPLLHIMPELLYEPLGLLASEFSTDPIISIPICIYRIVYLSSGFTVWSNATFIFIIYV